MCSWGVGTVSGTSFSVECSINFGLGVVFSSSGSGSTLVVSISTTEEGAEQLGFNGSAFTSGTCTSGITAG